MKFTGAMAIKGFGADKVIIHTDLPCATYPFEGYQTLSFDAAQNKGADYVKDHFDIIAEIIKRPNSTPKFRS